MTRRGDVQRAGERSAFADTLRQRSYETGRGGASPGRPAQNRLPPARH